MRTKNKFTKYLFKNGLKCCSDQIVHIIIYGKNYLFFVDVCKKIKLLICELLPTFCC